MADLWPISESFLDVFIETVDLNFPYISSFLNQLFKLAKLRHIKSNGHICYLYTESFQAVGFFTTKLRSICIYSRLSSAVLPLFRIIPMQILIISNYCEIPFATLVHLFSIWRDFWEI